MISYAKGGLEEFWVTFMNISKALIGPHICFLARSSTPFSLHNFAYLCSSLLHILPTSVEQFSSYSSDSLLKEGKLRSHVHLG